MPYGKISFRDPVSVSSMWAVAAKNNKIEN